MFYYVFHIQGLECKVTYRNGRSFVYIEERKTILDFNEAKKFQRESMSSRLIGLQRIKTLKREVFAEKVKGMVNIGCIMFSNSEFNKFITLIKLKENEQQQRRNYACPSGSHREFGV